MTSTFRSTHAITLDDGQIFHVMLDADADGAGPAYTEAEWESETPADYERHADLTWTFQGEAFAGSVHVRHDLRVGDRVTTSYGQGEVARVLEVRGDEIRVEWEETGGIFPGDAWIPALGMQVVAPGAPHPTMDGRAGGPTQ